MEISIYTLHVLQRHLLSQHHLVESANEEGVQKAAVENGEADNSTNKLEIVQMLGVNAGVGVDLEGVVVVGRVLE